jgi:hypothetical protein
VGLTRATKHTIGEQLFEEYLRSQSLSFSFEQLPPGKTRPPDYTVKHNLRDLLFEVKDFAEDDLPDGTSDGAYDPYERIRKKISKATAKFKEYESWPCCLVLYNGGALLVDLETPDIVLGSMYGDSGFSIPIDVDRGTACGPGKRRFLSRGKMVNPHTGAPQNKRISALITLRKINVGGARLNRYIKTLPQMGAAKLWNHLQSAELDFDQAEEAVGLIVWENAFAVADTPLPSDILCGPYDLRWGILGGVQQRTYVGEKLAELGIE